MNLTGRCGLMFPYASCSVFHFCATIRYWERLWFTYSGSARVNIDGTANIIKAVQDLPDTSEKILLHCSSAAICLPEPLFMRLGWNMRKGYASSYTVSDDREIPDNLRASHCYAQTKAVADKLVRQANGIKGVKTGVVSIVLIDCYAVVLILESSSSYAQAWPSVVLMTYILA